MHITLTMAANFAALVFVVAVLGGKIRMRMWQSPHQRGNFVIAVAMLVLTVTGLGRRFGLDPELMDHLIFYAWMCAATAFGYRFYELILIRRQQRRDGKQPTL